MYNLLHSDQEIVKRGSYRKNLSYLNTESAQFTNDTAWPDSGITAFLNGYLNKKEENFKERKERIVHKQG